MAKAIVAGSPSTRLEYVRRTQQIIIPIIFLNLFKFHLLLLNVIGQQISIVHRKLL